MRSFTSLTACAFVSIALVACSSELDERPSATSPHETLSLASPPQLRMLDRSDLRLDGMIAGRPVAMTAPNEGESWVVSLRVPPNRPIRITLTWSTGDGLPLAIIDGELAPVAASGPIFVRADAYRTDLFDEDADSFTNVEELRCGSDPRSDGSLPDVSSGNGCGFDEDFTSEDDLDDTFFEPDVDDVEPIAGDMNPPDDCDGAGGTDSASRNFSWDDNCTIARSGSFEASLYAVGIQRIVYCAGFADSAVADGEIGVGTEAAIESFQVANGLTSDGVVGAQTWATLQDSLELVELGTFEGEGPFFDGYGVPGERCAMQVLFYNEISLSDDGTLIELGWTLARRADSSERVEFSTALPFGLIEPAFNARDTNR